MSLRDDRRLERKPEEVGKSRRDNSASSVNEHFGVAFVVVSVEVDRGHSL